MRALTGFTRLDAPDPEDPDLVTRAPLARDRPAWVPASEVRGEGIFLRIDPALMATWEDRVRDSNVVREHMEAFKRFRTNRYSDRLRTDFDPLHGWPGPRYIALHTLSHLLIRTISLECGYSSASLSERIYSGQDQGGILIYTAVPDAEGTLGGLVSLAEPEPLTRIIQRALHDAQRCSSDPLCAERLPEGARRLPARRRLPRLPVRLRDHLRARQPVPRPALHRADRRPISRLSSRHELGRAGGGRLRSCSGGSARRRCARLSAMSATPGLVTRSCG